MFFTKNGGKDAETTGLARTLPQIKKGNVAVSVKIPR